MPAYIIVRIAVTDPEQYRKYTAVTPGIVSRFGGKFIVRGGPMETLEGPEEKDRIVVLEFPSRKNAEAFYHSPDYTAARGIREGAATGQFALIEGYDAHQSVSSSGSGPV